MARSAPTIPNASASGKPKLSIKKEDWLRIEKGYGHPLSDDVRERIREGICKDKHRKFEDRHRSRTMVASPICSVSAPSKRAGRRFIVGVPMKPATNRLAGA